MKGKRSNSHLLNLLFIIMHIGIITWFSYENYGTKLQAFALQKYLKELGNDVEIINFTPPETYMLKEKTSSLWDKIKNQPKKYKTKYILQKYNDEIRSRYKKMDGFIDNNCNLTIKADNDDIYVDVCNSFDLLICGSDQIWNPNLYHKYYFADFEKIKTPKISYAPSLGVNKINSEVEPNLKRSLEKFSFVTVREDTGANLLRNIIKKDIPVVLDPTLLLSKNTWIKYTNNDFLSLDDYVLCYFLSDNKNHWKAASRFAKSHNLQLIIIPQEAESYEKNCKICPEAGVEDFLGLILNATYVITDSFHGTVFSLIFQKQFYTFERFKENKYSSQNSRIRNLLEKVSLNSRLIEFNQKIIDDKNNINYKIIDLKLKENVERSKEELNRGLKYAKKV